MKYKILSLLLALTLAFGMTACAKTSGADPATNAAATAVPTQDRQGNSITVPKNINKIAAMAPSIAETLVDLGLGDKIVAVDSNSAKLPGLRSDVLVLDMMNPDAEQLAQLAPDILFASGMSQTGDSTDPFKAVKDIGICTAYIPTSDSIQGIQDDIRFLAAATKTTEVGATLITQMEKEIDRISDIGLTITEKKTVYFEISAAPAIYSFGSGVYLNEMLELIGAKNVFADQNSWISVTPEAAVNANADVILTNVNYIDDPVAEIKSRSGWGEMNALKNGEVYYIDNQASSTPDAHIVKALEAMASAIYPDKYPADEQ